MKSDKKRFFNFLKELVENWKLVMGQYVKNSKNDIPYWHNERANTSFLAAAAWKMGGVVIEEYCVERGKRRSKGRCDLWVKHGRFSFSAEVKQSWATKDPVRSIKSQLKSARKQLTNIRSRDKKESSVCVCFLSPGIKEKNYKILIKEFRKKVRDYVKNGNINLIMEEYFPIVSEKRITWDRERYPGVMIVLEILNRKLK